MSEWRMSTSFPPVDFGQIFFSTVWKMMLLILTELKWKLNISYVTIGLDAEVTSQIGEVWFVLSLSDLFINQ